MTRRTGGVLPTIIASMRKVWLEKGRVFSRLSDKASSLPETATQPLTLGVEFNFRSGL
jgi:hypothetical protein